MKVKLSEKELERKILYERHELRDGDCIGDLASAYGASAYVEKEYGYYDDPDEWWVVIERKETDEEYTRRIEALTNAYEAQAEAEKERKRKQAEAERRTYLRLKKKFEQ